MVAIIIGVAGFWLIAKPGTQLGIEGAASSPNDTYLIPSNPATQPTAIIDTTIEGNRYTTAEMTVAEPTRMATAKYHFGPYWRGHLSIDARFKANYQKAMEGDPNSILNLLDVFQDCYPVRGFESKGQIAELFLKVESSPIIDNIMKSTEFMFDDCWPVWNYFPTESEDYWRQYSLLIDTAAAAGNATAQLMQFDREHMLRPLQSEQMNHSRGQQEAELIKINQLLNDALRTKDHHAFRLARSLFNHFDSRDSTLQVDFWNHAACSYDPYCDLVMYEANATHLFLHEVERINIAISRLDQRLENPEPIRFQRMFSSPLQLPDGSMWFEYD